MSVWRPKPTPAPTPISGNTSPAVHHHPTGVTEVIQKGPRVYPDGSEIPTSLPTRYRLSERCDNCLYIVAEANFCSAFKAPVRPDYVCLSWHAKP
jgi:hypothetical protein